jgi:hypothetical protein
MLAVIHVTALHIHEEVATLYWSLNVTDTLTLFIFILGKIDKRENRQWQKYACLTLYDVFERKIEICAPTIIRGFTPAFIKRPCIVKVFRWK